MEFVQNRFNVDINRVFAGDYLDAKGLYWALNGNIPLLNSVFPIDIEKVKSYLLENFKEEINNVFQSSNLNNNINKKRYVMEESYIVFKNKMVIKLAYNYCDILSNEQDHTFVESLTLKIKKFHRRERKKEFEINLISFDNNTFTLKEIEIKGKSLFKQRDDQISHSFKALTAGVCIFADRPAHFAARDLVAAAQVRSPDAGHPAVDRLDIGAGPDRGHCQRKPAAIRPGEMRSGRRDDG